MTMLHLGGFIPLTTLDYPDHLSAVVFCQGCEWRCDYCHNPELLAQKPKKNIENIYKWDDILHFLQHRQGLLDAVVFSGGEPLFQTGLAAAMQEVKELGFQVALHTAGTDPQQLAQLLPSLDWVGLDIKALETNYPTLTHHTESGQQAWQSLQLLLDSGVDYEVRTTVHPAFFTPESLLDLARQLAAQGVKHYVVQTATTDTCLNTRLRRSGRINRQQIETSLQALFPHFIWRDA